MWKLLKGKSLYKRKLGTVKQHCWTFRTSWEIKQHNTKTWSFRFPGLKKERERAPSYKQPHFSGICSTAHDGDWEVRSGKAGTAFIPPEFQPLLHLGQSYLGGKLVFWCLTFLFCKILDNNSACHRRILYVLYIQGAGEFNGVVHLKPIRF